MSGNMSDRKRATRLGLDGPASTSVEAHAVALHQRHADGTAGRVAFVLAVQIALPCEQLPLLIQVLLPLPSFSLCVPSLSAARLAANSLLSGPVPFPGLRVVWVFPAEHRQSIHIVVGDVVPQELREAGRHHPHAAALVA